MLYKLTLTYSSTTLLYSWL